MNMQTALPDTAARHRRRCVAAVRVLVGLVTGVLLAALPAAAAPLPLGPAIGAAALPNGAQISLGGGGSLRVEFLAHGIVHVNVTPPGRSTLPTGAVILQTPAAGTAEFFQDADKVYLRQAGLAAIVMKNPLQLVLMRADGSVISSDLPGGAQFDSASGMVVSIKHARPDERFFGMGLAGGPLDRRGRSMTMVYDPLWAFTAANKWFVTGPTGDPLVANIWMGDVSFVDFTKPAARDFFKGALKTFVSTGVSGLWADLNEPAANDLPYAVFDFEGQPRYEFASRNVYALWETATLRDALLEAQPGLRPFIVSRSGFAGIQRYAANWSGDTYSTWDSLRVQVQVANSMGLSGQNFFGADIGGFLGAPDAELFLRWLQFGSATPFMRNHSMNTSPLREPWRFGEPYTSAARSIIGWRYRLMPYLYGLFAAAESAGTPVLAPTFFHHPSDPGTHLPSSEFMLGASILVAPVTTPGASTRSLYLPAGASWFNYYTDTLHAGGQQLSVSAPIHQLPLMVRAGSIVPMGPVRQYAAQTVADESLLLDIFPGADASFVVRDDDGATTAYRSGAFRDTALRWTETASVAQLSTTLAGGSLAASPRPWWLQVRAWSAAPSRVLADGVVLTHAAGAAGLGDAGGWAYDAGTRRLVIRAPGRQAAALIRIER
jgi:alpha-glucosidase